LAEPFHLRKDTFGMRQALIVAALVLSAAFPAAAQIVNLPTEAANPPSNDVWVWIEQPVGTIARDVRVFRFWAFRCGGTITAVRPSVAQLFYVNPALAQTAGNTLSATPSGPTLSPRWRRSAARSRATSATN
jgi:hypothetical protein